VTTSTSSASNLDAWAEAIVAADAYPQRVAGVYILGAGPHFGAGLTIDTAAAL
jgi:enoyl-CoA hydratase/carnithine racemase